jgi:hypothetical protein
MPTLTTFSKTWQASLWLLAIATNGVAARDVAGTVSPN